MKRKLLAIFCIVAIALALFAYTVRIRSQWFGYFSGENHDWLSGSTLIFTQNWDREGIWSLRFGMYDDPKSPEFPSLLDRSPYVSYPPGAAVPVFIISQLTGQPPSLDMIMAYNLANHLLIAIVLALTVFFFLDKFGLDLKIVFFFSLPPLFLELLLPAPLYFHQNSFFSDQAVILPFALVVLLEVLRSPRAGRSRTIISVLQALVILYGVWTDWLFVFVLIALFIKRLVAGEIGLRNRKAFLQGTAKLWALPLAALAAFLYYVYLIMGKDLGNAWFELTHKFFVRTGGHETESRLDFVLNVTRNADRGYGRLGVAIIYVSVLAVLALGGFLIVRKLRKKTVSGELELITLLALIIVVPCVLQIATFLNHSSVHNFSVLKLSVIVSVVPFVLIPLLVGLAIRHYTRINDLSRIMLMLIAPVILVMGVYLALTHGGYVDYFGDRNQEWYQEADTVNLHARADDVVFSDKMDLPDKPPQLLSLTMKRVYKVDGVEQILQKVDGIQGDFRVMIILATNQPGSVWSDVVKKADSVAPETNGYTYVFFSSDSIGKLRN